MAEWASVGKHLYYVQDDLIVIRASGTFEMPQAQWLMETTNAIVKTYGYSLMLADVSAGIAIPPEVRRWIGEWHKTHSADNGTAVAVGAGAVVRTLLTLINSGVRLLGMATGDLVFAKDEADGWRLVAQRRKMWRERVAAKPPSARSQR